MATITTINANDQITDSRSVINTNFDNLNTDKVETSAIDTDTTLSADSDTKVASQKATKAYVDGAVFSMPAGAVLPYAVNSAPSGWLLCYGQEVSRTTYAALFAAIGTTYGVGDGSSTFNVPDLRGRVIAGIDNLGGSSANTITDSNADSMGGEFGSETHTLTEAELPAHNHDITTYDGAGSSGKPSDGNAAGGAGTTATSENAGSGSAHNNVQPTTFMAYIIKT